MTSPRARPSASNGSYDHTRRGSAGTPEPSRHAASQAIAPGVASPSPNPTSARAFVRVAPEGGGFTLEGQPYRFLGTNFWYGMPLGSPGAQGDRARLVRELDRLQALGLSNLRILVGSEGPENEPWRMKGALQPAPGHYDEAQRVGLDFLLVEMARRGMKAVACLSNMWQWSGGFAAYVAWVTGRRIPYPGHSNAPQDWDRFQEYAARFYALGEAQELYFAHLKAMTTRVNTLSGTPYNKDPTIMSWQLANEPRGCQEAEAYVRWVAQSAALLKQLAPEQLVSVGSEGRTPWPNANTRFPEVHALGDIDYVTFHLWVQNWTWFDPKDGNEGLDQALSARADPYLTDHLAVAQTLRKPAVLEEFGLSRDGGSCDPAATCNLRDRFYGHVFEKLSYDAEPWRRLSGANFWAWSGESRPTSPGADWKAGDPYTGDPPHEPQGWYGVYDQDESTAAVIRRCTRALTR